MKSNLTTSINPAISWDELHKLLFNKFKTKGFSAFSSEERKIINDFSANNPDHPNGLITQGYVAWSDGKIDQASSNFSSAMKLVSHNIEALSWFDIGITSWLPEGTDINEEVNSKLFFPEAENIHFIRRSDSIKPGLTILSACDELYFRRHGKVFFAIAQRDFADYNVHLHVINPSQDTKVCLANSQIQNLSVTIEEENSHSSRAYYATCRFLIAPALLEIYNTDFLITDIDMIPSEGFHHTLSRLLNEDFDLACAKLPKTWMPWNSYLATALLVRKTVKSHGVLNKIASYTAKVFRNLGGLENAWFVDQNALFYAIQQGLNADQLKFQPIGRFGRLFLGPSILGKDSFAGICQNYVDATDSSWNFITPISPLIDLYRSDLPRDPILFNRILSSYDFISVEDFGYLTDYLLALYLSDKLADALNDQLLAKLLQRKSYGLAVSLINKLRHIKTPFPIGTPKNIFNIDAHTEDTIIEHLVNLLLHKGFDRSVTALRKMYQGSDNQTIARMRVASIRQMLRMGATKEARNEIEQSFSGVVMVVGLQRSGTNYVSELLRLNTNAYVPYSGDNTIFWKHSLPNESGVRVNKFFLDPVDALNRLNARCIVVTKNPISWVESITKRNCVDFFNSRKQAVKGQDDLKSIVEFYRHFIESWKNVIERVTFVEYEAVLADPNVLFNSATGVCRTSTKIVIPASVEMSRKFRSSDKERYLKGESTLSQNDIKLIRSILPDSFFKDA